VGFPDLSRTLVFGYPKFQQAAQPPEIAVNPGQLLDLFVIDNAMHLAAATHLQKIGGQA